MRCCRCVVVVGIPGAVRPTPFRAKRRSIALLFKYFNARQDARYPVYIYHDYLTPAHVSRLAAAAAPHDDLLRLLPLGPVFDSPKKVAELGEKVPKAVRGYGLGYRHMCRYFCGPIFAEAELQQFEYIWRLDSDSFLLGPAAADPIQSVAARNATYGWIHAYRDEQARADIAPADLDPTISSPLTPHPIRSSSLGCGTSLRDSSHRSTYRPIA